MRGDRVDHAAVSGVEGSATSSGEDLSYWQTEIRHILAVDLILLGQEELCFVLAVVSPPLP
jgi:hypothetical protein